MIPPAPLFQCNCGPKGPQRARRAHTRPKAARASVARPLYLKLPIRHTIRRGTRQAKMPHIRQTKSHTYHSIICTEKLPVQDVTTPPSANIRGMGFCTDCHVSFRACKNSAKHKMTWLRMAWSCLTSPGQERPGQATPGLARPGLT